MLESVADSGIFLYNDVMGVRNMANETDQALDKKTLILAEAERILRKRAVLWAGTVGIAEKLRCAEGGVLLLLPGWKEAASGSARIQLPQDGARHQWAYPRGRNGAGFF